MRPNTATASIIWSHYHWDHVGDVSKFPASTALIVGPGFLKDPSLLPGYPENLNSPVPADAFQGREVVEPDFPLNVAGYCAHDFFGDGSFYLLGASIDLFVRDRSLIFD